MEQQQVDCTVLYTTHGVELSKNGSQAKGDCPFCGHTAFYVNLVEKMREGKKIEPGMWDCMYCGARGNQYDFLRMLLDSSRKTTTKDDYKQLAQQRGLSPVTIQRNGLVKSSLNGVWLIPVRNNNKGLSNVYTYDGKETRSSPGCSHQLWGVDELDRSLPTYVVEGHSDRMAWKQVIYDLGIKANVLGCPGAHTFKDKWLVHLAGSDVSLMFDNDEAGAKGMDRVTEMILSESNTERPTRLRRIQWPDNGTYKDIRDVLLMTRDAQMTYDILTPMLADVELPDPSVQYRTFTAIDRLTFDELLADFESQNIMLSEAFEHCFASALAVSVGIRFRAEPLWILIVGPPSSGKSTICEAMSCSRKFVIPQSSLTSNSLDSGWQAEGGKDVSLIPMLDGKVLVCKDFTTILSLPQTTQDRILGVLRDANDGVYRSKHGGIEGMGREYWSRFGIVAGVTYDIRTIKKVTLGDKFLQVEITDRTRRVGVEMDRNMLAINQMDKEMFEDTTGPEAMDHLRSCTLGFMERLHERIERGISRPVDLDDVHKRKIASMAEFCSIMRSQVKRDVKEKLMVRPSREQGQRLSKQLFKMAVCLGVVTDEGVSDRVMRFTKRTAMNTSAGFPMDVTRLLISNGETTAQRISDRCNLSPGNVRSALEDMKDLGMVRVTRHGHSATVYSASKEIVTLWESMK